MSSEVQIDQAKVDDVIEAIDAYGMLVVSMADGNQSMLQATAHWAAMLIRALRQWGALNEAEEAYVVSHLIDDGEKAKRRLGQNEVQDLLTLLGI